MSIGPTHNHTDSAGLTSDEVHGQIEMRLAQRDHRYTTGRRRLVSALVDAARPITLPEIVADAPDLAPSSAYRNLDVLEQCGAIRRISANGDHTYFELAEPLLGHHHHLICDTCGAIEDVHLDHETEAMVEANLAAAAAAAEFEPAYHRLDLHGRCRNCATTQ